MISMHLSLSLLQMWLLWKGPWQLLGKKRVHMPVLNREQRLLYRGMKLGTDKASTGRWTRAQILTLPIRTVSEETFCAVPWDPRSYGNGLQGS